MTVQPTRDYVGLVVFNYRRTHERVLKLIVDLSDDQLGWRPLTHPHSIGFTAWHMARWADNLQAKLPMMTDELGRRLGTRSEIWAADGLAERWGWSARQLGYADTGMLLEDDIVAGLALPPKTVVLDYVQRAFGAADEAVGAIDDAQWLEVELTNPPNLIGSAIVTHLTHDNRHLGEIELLRGLLGLAGTATR